MEGGGALRWRWVEGWAKHEGPNLAISQCPAERSTIAFLSHANECLISGVADNKLELGSINGIESGRR